MTRISIGLVALCMLALIGCGDAREAANNPAANAPSEPAQMGHSGHAEQGVDPGDDPRDDHGPSDEAPTYGTATGVIKNIDAQNKSLIIDHGPIDGIGMGAMTMAFDVAAGVELGDMAEEDRVTFDVEVEGSHSFTITRLCKTDSQSNPEGHDCTGIPAGQ